MSVQPHAPPPSPGKFTRLKNWWTGVSTTIEEDVKTRMYATFNRSIMVAVRKQEYKNYTDYILNAYKPSEFRMHVLCCLFKSCITQAGPKDDANLAELDQIWNELVSKFWDPDVYLMKHRKEELLGIRKTADWGTNAPLDQIEVTMALVASKHFIHRGLTLCDLTWPEADHIPEFTTVMQSMPPPSNPAKEGSGAPSA